MTALILGLTVIRAWYTMWTCTRLGNDIKGIKMQIGQVRSMSKTKVDVKNDLQSMDIKQLASMFGIDPKILDNPIIKGFLDGVMSPKEDKEKDLNR